MMKRSGSLYWALVFSIVFGNASAIANLAAASSPSITQDVKSVVDKVRDVVQDPKYKDDKTKRRAKLRSIIDPKFDYVEMGKRSLGKRGWTSRTREEQKKFIDLFGKLLENSYASKIESFHDEKISYEAEIIRGKYAMVKTLIRRRDDTIKVDYKMINSGGVWRVYDFVIEDVSMVRNYRSQFSKIIRKESFQTLMDKLDRKVAELEKEDKISTDEL
ncbi:MAG: phospholipid-binding protein MlaC [Nitrospinaceae bacterium]